MKKITVILTTYNSANTIQRALDSLFMQDGLNKDFLLEILIIDDCSTDETRNILEMNKINFHLTKSNSGGPNIGRNIGLEKATGDYICIMDHDDAWLPDKIKSQLAYCHIAPIISTGYTTINDVNGDRKDYVSVSKDGKGYIVFKEDETFLTLLSRTKKGQKTYIGGLLFDSSLKHIRFEEKFAQVDFDWGLRLFRSRKSLEICRPLYIRNILGNNLSLKEEYRLNDYNFSTLTVEKYKEEFPRQAREFSWRSNGTMGRYYYHKEEMDLSRKYFRKAGFSLKTMFYILTSYYGYRFVNRHFRVF
jgi:glycosyltransferase involved in cell wall biosynthesis